MKIKELYIENFGKLTGYRQAFNDGLNTFQNDNGYGKTTLTVFIKAMLYGLEDTRRQNLSENDRKKYSPWQGGAFGGWLAFESGGKWYRVERTFGQKASDDTFSLYEVDTGMPSNRFSANLGEELFGIDADGFERTAFLSEKNLRGKNDNPTISAKLSNLVGVEGDIGGFDEAIELLEKRRKFYQKRGGSGEIQETKRSIALTEEALFSLDKKQKLCRENEKLISDTASKISFAKARKDTLLEKQREYIIKKEKESYTARYQEMMLGLREDEAKKERICEFFAKKLPTAAEIAEADAYLNEARRLENQNDSLTDDSEYYSLSAFFSSGASYEECEDAVRLSKTLENSGDFIKGSEDITTRFLRIPTETEIEEVSLKLSSKDRKLWTERFPLLTLAGFIILGIGLALGLAISGAFYSLCAAGAIISAIGIAGQVAKHADSSSDVADFIKEIYGEDYPIDNKLSTLISMRAELEIYKSKLLEAKKEQELRQARQRWLDEFLSRFPVEAPSITEKTRLIQSKYQRFLFLEQSIGTNREQRVAALERAAILRRAAEDFTSLFPTVTDDPIGEIRNRFSEFELIRAAVESKALEAERFAIAHGISANDEYISFSDDSVELTRSITETDGELIELERQKSIAESEYALLSRELEERPALEERLRELNEKISIYEENLGVIQKTKQLLSNAKASMTAKYLDGTRRAFEKYISLIENECGEFSLDTSFNVTKRDLGASRPEDAYSRGTKDIRALAVRLALIDALYESDSPPIVLDDPFIAFDDTRTQRALEILEKLSESKQIIYLTCSKSRYKNKYPENT